MESMEINERENVIFLRLSNYKNTLFLLCSCTSQKPSHGDISGTKSGIIDLLVSKQRKQISEEKNKGLAAERKAKKIQVGIVSFGCNLGEMFTFMGRT